jgi:hypothetical protein
MEQRAYGNFDLELDAEGAFQLLGQGTFGRTYLARHRFLDTPAALKVINARYAAEFQARERFLSEARSVAKLEHKHIARVLDFGEASGVLFYAMEYCCGGTLEQRCALSGGLQEADWFEVARQVTSALVCCHEAGFIHRDIKPSNLMLAYAGGPLCVKLIDFGMVRSIQKILLDSEGGEGMGSPLYASPEQLREGALDARSDLFSLGMSLWFAAIGRVPDAGSPSQVIDRRLDARGYEAELPKSLPQAVREMLLALLQKDPAGRPQSAKEFLHILELGAGRLSSVSVELDDELDKQAASQVEVIVVDQDLKSEFELVRTEGQQATGINHIAKHLVADGSMVWLHVFHPRLWAEKEFRDEVLGNVLQISGAEVLGLIQPVQVRVYRDYAVVLSRPPNGVPLLLELRSAGKLSLAENVEFLEKIAVVVDWLSGVGLPAPDLRPAQIYCQNGDVKGSGISEPTMVPCFASGKNLDSAARDGILWDASATMAVDALTSAGSGDSSVGAFARLVYRMAAGRDCVSAASLSVQAYVAVPELSEEGNRFLSRLIAGVTVPTSCAAVLATVMGTEKVPARGQDSVPNVAAAKSHAEQVLKELGKISRAQEPVSADVVLVRSSVSGEAALQRALMAPSSDGVKSTGQTVFEALSEPLERGVGEDVLRLRGRAAKFWVGYGAAGIGIGLAAAWFFASSARIPEGAVLRFEGDLPGHSQFKVNGAAVSPRRSGRLWEVPLGGGARFPVSVVVEAAGYEEYFQEISRISQLREIVPVRAKRARGVLLFKQSGLSDYDHFAVEIEEALPGEEGVDLHKGERIGDSLRDSSETRVELPTGQYLLTLGGMPSVVSSFSPEQRIHVKSGETVVFSLPPSYSGRYKGQSEQGAVVLKVGRELRSGEISFEAGGAERSGKIRRFKLDNSGTLNAEFLDSAGGIPWDLTAKISADGEVLQVTLVPRGANSVPQTFRLHRVREM